jgi:hypothetical protein
MKKYKKINKDNLKDELYQILENYKLTEEEKAEFDIIINSYVTVLQKIDKNSFDNLKSYLVKTLTRKDNV